MNNFKGIALLVALFAINSNVAASQYRLSSHATKFVNDSKARGMGSYFQNGLMREDWLTSAVASILYVNATTSDELTAKNKESVIQKLNQMSDTLVGVPLRRNQKISDAQYNAITNAISAQISTFVNRHVGQLFI